MGQDSQCYINNQNNEVYKISKTLKLDDIKNPFNTKHYMWIDKNVYAEDFQLVFDCLFNEKKKCSKFDTVDKAIEYLLNNIEFEETIIIVSGSFFPDFYKKFDENINKIKVSPIVVVFCQRKEFFISNLKINNIYVNNYLLNEDLIFESQRELEDYLNEGKIKEKEEEELTFEIIKNLEELTAPCFYSYLLQDVTGTEIFYFNEKIISMFNNENNEIEENEIKSMIISLQRCNLNSKEIISKYWLRIYTYESKFYKNLNKFLRTKNKNSNFFYPLIKICYEGIRKKFLFPVLNKKLYRGSLISKEEIENLMEIKNKNDFPKTIVYCRSFLSFSENLETTKFRMWDELNINKNLERVLFEMEEINKIPKEENENNDIDLNSLSNCSLKSFSKKRDEDEVLFFPFSCFEVTNIEKKKKNDLTYYKINLKNMGRLGNIIKNQLKTDFFKEMKMSKYAEDLTKAKITINENFISSWKLKKEFKNDYKIICFMLNNEYFVTKTDNSISLISYLYEEEKLKINFENTKIICLIKIDENRLCISNSNNYIELIKLLNNNKTYIKKEKKLDLCANNLLYIRKEEEENDIIMFSNKNSIYYLYTKKEKKTEKWMTEDNNIIAIKELPNGDIAYLTEYNNGNNNKNIVINFIDIMKKNELISMKLDRDFYDFIDFIIFKNYCIIGFNSIIDLIDYEKNIEFHNQNRDSNKSKQINVDYYEKKNYTSFYLENKLTNIIKFKGEELIIGLYDENKKNSIIREIYINYENDSFNPYILGEGKIDNYIKKIIEINKSNILVNIRNGKLFIMEKENETDTIFKELYNKYNVLESPIKGIIPSREQNYCIYCPNTNISKNLNYEKNYLVDKENIKNKIPKNYNIKAQKYKDINTNQHSLESIDFPDAYRPSSNKNRPSSCQNRKNKKLNYN